MKKLLTLITAICLIATCVVPVGAASYDLEGLRYEYELGNPVSLFAFTGSDAASFTKRAGDSLTDADGVLTVSKSEGTTATTLDTYDSDMLEAYRAQTYLFSFKFKMDYATDVKYSSGSSYNSTNEVMHLEFKTNGTVDYYTDTDKTTKTVTIDNQSSDDWTKVDILFDNAKDKYYLWVNESANPLTQEPLIDGCAYMQDKNQQSFRIWTGTVPEANKANLCVKDITVTSLINASFIPAVGTEGYAYEETFPNTYGAYNADSEPWKTFEGTVLKERSSSNAQKCNAADFTVSDDGALKITQSSGTYHNWYFTNDAGYKAAEPNANRLVIQVDIKSSATTTIHLGSYAASAVRVRVTTDGSKLTARYNGDDNKVADLDTSFVYSEGVDGAPYTTLTFLLEENCYSLWMGTNKVIDKANNNSDNKADSISFITSEAGDIIYVDNIRVFEAPADFMNVYSFINSVTDINDFITTDADGIVSFGVNSELDASSVSVEYRDSKGYYDGNDIVFPLFGDSADVRAVISSNGNYAQVVFGEDVVFPAGYTDIARIVDAGTKTASFDVILRNDVSARTDELIVMAAAYDSSGKIIKIKGCAFENNAFVADFGDGVEYASAEAFVWEKTTLRPVQ